MGFLLCLKTLISGFVPLFAPPRGLLVLFRKTRRRSPFSNRLIVRIKYPGRIDIANVYIVGLWYPGPHNVPKLRVYSLTRMNAWVLPIRLTFLSMAPVRERM